MSGLWAAFGGWLKQQVEAQKAFYAAARAQENDRNRKNISYSPAVDGECGCLTFDVWPRDVNDPMTLVVNPEGEIVSCSSELGAYLKNDTSLAIKAFELLHDISNEVNKGIIQGMRDALQKLSFKEAKLVRRRLPSRRPSSSSGFGDILDYDGDGDSGD